MIVLARVFFVSDAYERSLQKPTIVASTFVAAEPAISVPSNPAPNIWYALENWASRSNLFHRAFAPALVISYWLRHARPGLSPGLPFADGQIQTSVHAGGIADV